MSRQIHLDTFTGGGIIGKGDGRHNVNNVAEEPDTNHSIITICKIFKLIEIYIRKAGGSHSKEKIQGLINI